MISKVIKSAPKCSSPWVNQSNFVLFALFLFTQKNAKCSYLQKANKITKISKQKKNTWHAKILKYALNHPLSLSLKIWVFQEMDPSYLVGLFSFSFNIFVCVCVNMNVSMEKLFPHSTLFNQPNNLLSYSQISFSYWIQPLYFFFCGFLFTFSIFSSNFFYKHECFKGKKYIKNIFFHLHSIFYLFLSLSLPKYKFSLIASNYRTKKPGDWFGKIKK